MSHYQRSLVLLGGANRATRYIRSSIVALFAYGSAGLRSVRVTP